MVQTSDFFPYALNMSNIGWICPKCARCFSPQTAMCYFCPAAFGASAIPTVTVTTTDLPKVNSDPSQPLYPYPDMWVPATETRTDGVAPLTVGQGVAPLTVGHFPPKK